MVPTAQLGYRELLRPNQSEGEESMYLDLSQTAKKLAGLFPFDVGGEQLFLPHLVENPS